MEGSKIYFLHPLFENQFDVYPSFKKFLDEKCVRNLDGASIVERVILPKYKYGNLSFNESEYQADLQWIVKAPHTPGVKQTLWLACVHASGNRPDAIIWKRPNASETDSPTYHYYGNQEFEAWRKESTIYVRNHDHETWFSGLENIDAYFLHPITEKELAEHRSLVKPIDKLEKISNDSQDRKGFSELQSGFNPNKIIIGLKEGLNIWSIDKFNILWKMLLQNPKIICGEIKKARFKYQLNSAKKEIEYTEVGRLCRESECIQDKQGNWHNDLAPI